jgi:ABC-type lipoprotein release transport system permease subunit
MLEYIRRGITRRKRQSAIVIIGMALAVAAVMIVSAASAGITAAQHNVLSSIYGVGTDITVTKTASAAGQSGGPFQFGSGAGQTSSSGSTDLSTTRVSVARGSSALAQTTLSKVKSTSGVTAATATLALTQTKFSGSFQQGQTSSGDSGSSSSGDSSSQSSGPGAGQSGRPSFGGGSFDLNETTILGIDPTATGVGPTTDFTVSTGRLLKKSDTKAAVISSSYAKDKSLKVGSTVSLGGSDTEATVVGILSSASSQSASDVYIPLSLAQSLSSDVTGKVTTIYVKSGNADQVSTVAEALKKTVSGATVSTQADLAGSISGSLASAAGWITGFGRWLTIGILALAFLLASLFTVASISRRTRELGTLKAIGWSNVRVLGNITAETLIQAVLGGLVGLIIGAGAIVGINAAKISLDSSTTPTFSTSQQAGGAAGAPGGGAGSAPGAASGESGANQTGTGSRAAGARSRTATAAKTTLTLSPSAGAIGLGVGASVLGGLVAAGAGSVKVSRLRPAAALRSID